MLSAAKVTATVHKPESSEERSRQLLPRMRRITEQVSSIADRLYEHRDIKATAQSIIAEYRTKHQETESLRTNPLGLSSLAQTTATALVNQIKNSIHAEARQYFADHYTSHPDADMFESTLCTSLANATISIDSQKSEIEEAIIKQVQIQLSSKKETRSFLAAIRRSVMAR
jgi:hypothetical protein